MFGSAGIGGGGGNAGSCGGGGNAGSCGGGARAAQAAVAAAPRAAQAAQVDGATGSTGSSGNNGACTGGGTGTAAGISVERMPGPVCQPASADRRIGACTGGSIFGGTSFGMMSARRSLRRRHVDGCRLRNRAGWSSPALRYVGRLGHRFRHVDRCRCGRRAAGPASTTVTSFESA